MSRILKETKFYPLHMPKPPINPKYQYWVCGECGTQYSEAIEQIGFVNGSPRCMKCRCSRKRK